MTTVTNITKAFVLEHKYHQIIDGLDWTYLVCYHCDAII